MLLVVTASVTAPVPAHADSGDRQAASVLDALPLLPDADVSEIADRSRTYVVGISPEAILSFYRTQLPAQGWKERNVAQSTGQASGPEGESTGSGSGSVGDDDATGPFTARFSRSDARLTVVVRSIADSEAPTGTTTGDDQSDRSRYRLRVTPR